MTETRNQSITEYYQKKVYVKGLPTAESLSELDIKELGKSKGFSNWKFAKSVDQISKTGIKFKELSEAVSRAMNTLDKVFNEKRSAKM
jgi:hypothetical protein